MKRLFISIVCICFIMSACHSEQLNLNKVEHIREKVSEHIDPNLNLQLIYDDEKGVYVVFQSNRSVEEKVESEGNVVNIIFNKLDQKNEDIQRHTYYLTVEEEHDTLLFFVNGEEVSVDNITGI